jgi:hypothetical protein
MGSKYGTHDRLDASDRLLVENMLDILYTLPSKLHRPRGLPVLVDQGPPVGLVRRRPQTSHFDAAYGTEHRYVELRYDTAQK